MSPRTTLLLAFVALALGAFLYFYEIAGRPQRDAALNATSALFPGLAAAEIDEIELHSSDGVTLRSLPVRSVRQDGRWNLVEPVSFPADSLLFDRFADTLAGLARVQEIGNPQPLADYGLGDDRPPIRFRSQGRDFALRLGEQAPLGAHSYALVLGPSDEPLGDVLVVPSESARVFERSLDDLRDKRVLAFGPDAVRSIEASWPGGSVTLVRDNGDQAFRMIVPLESESDERVVRELLSKLSYLRAEGFVDEPSESVLESFASPDFALTLDLEGVGGTSPRELRLLVAAPGDGAANLAKASERALYRLAPDVIDELPRSVLAYRFKDLMRFDPAEATEIEMHFADPSTSDPQVVAVVKTDGRWEGSPDPWVRGKADAFVRALKELEASDIVAESMGDDERAALGLEPPWIRILAKTATGDTLAELHLGESQGERGVVARVPGRETILRMDYLAGARIPIRFDAYLNRFKSLEVPRER